MNRVSFVVAAGLAILCLIGCASESEAPKATAVAQAQPATPSGAGPQGDIQTLQQGRKRDAQVIQDAQKAVGALGH